MVNHPRVTALNVDTGEVDSEKSASLQEFADRTTAAKEVALDGRKCMPAPIGCGEPVAGFEDEVSRREYEITGMCQTCQNNFYAAMAAEEDADG